MPDWIAKSRQQASEVLGVGPRQITEYCSRGCPGSRGKYPIPEMITWFREHVWSPQAELVEGDPLLASGAESPWLERYRKERTQLARLDRMERQGSLIPLEKVHEGLVIFSEKMRGALDLIQQDFPDAAKILEDALGETELAYRDRFGKKPNT